MSDDNDPKVYLPYNFVGEWNILTQAHPQAKSESQEAHQTETGPRLRTVTIERQGSTALEINYEYIGTPDPVEYPEKVLYIPTTPARILWSARKKTLSTSRSGETPRSMSSSRSPKENWCGARVDSRMKSHPTSRHSARESAGPGKSSLQKERTQQI